MTHEPGKAIFSRLALAAAVQWVASFAVSVSFPGLAETAGLALTYGIFALFAAASFTFVRRTIRETCGKELEDMPEGLLAARP
jgi:SP family sugar:H+ symporter-like MFS transporter